MSPLPTKRWPPLLALVAAMAIWGSSFPAFKYVLGYLDGWLIVWVRMLVASVLLLLAWPLLGARGLNRFDLKWIAILGVCEPCLYFLFETYALQLTTSSQAGVIVAMLPLMAAAAAGWILKEEITPRLLGGMVLAVLGAVGMSLAANTTEVSPRPILGNFLEFCAMACATGYIIAVKKLSSRHSALFLVAVQCWIGVVFFAPLAILGGGFEEAWASDASVHVWLILLYLSTVVTLLAFFLYNFGLRYTPASQASVYGNLLPLFAVLLSFLILGESFTLGQIAGCALILVGLVISQTGANAA